MSNRLYFPGQGRFRLRWPLREFLEEWRAVREGMARYRARGADTARYLLRRNLHRIEKGLMMPGARSVFAAEYIAETVSAYELLRREGGCEAREDLRAAQGVLTAYFARVAAHPAVDEARRRFESLPPAEAPGEGNDILPFHQDELGPAPLSPEQLLAALRHRKSIRWFLQRPVPREHLDRAVAAAALAPSACNRQAFRYHILDTPDRVRAAASLLLGVSGFDHQIPVLVVVVGCLRGYEHSRDRHLIYVDGGLSAMNFMLALDTLGLASCPVNWPDRPRENRQLAALLNLAPDERAVMLMAVGYPDPDGAVACSPRKSVADLRTYS